VKNENGKSLENWRASEEIRPHARLLTFGLSKEINHA